MYPLSKFPGYSMVGLKVTMAPGGATPPHRHGSATVTGVVLSGHTYNKMNNEPTHLLGPGETFHEHPGCHHKTSMNASDSEEHVTNKQGEIIQSFTLKAEDQWLFSNPSHRRSMKPLEKVEAIKEFCERHGFDIKRMRHHILRMVEDETPVAPVSG